MKALADIDMSEVTRLTKAGRLSEAMALLRGGMAEPVGDMPNPSAIAGARPANPWSAGAPGGAARHQAPEAMRAFLDRMGKLPSATSLGGLQQPLHAPSRIPLPDGARFDERSFSNEAGSRDYKLYVPSGYSGQSVPMIVMLHGCTQSPDDFAAGTRMNDLAEEHLFLVAYPGQTQAANASKCWNWFNVNDQQRDRGEPSLIAGITRQLIRDFSVDPRRVYVAGLSAGGAAAAIMGSAYPDIYAAVGVHSGLPCGAARDMASAFAAMRQGGAPQAKVRRSEHALRRFVPTIVFHGDHDKTVNPVNSDQIIAQAKARTPLPETVSLGKSEEGMAYTRTAQMDETGQSLLEQWVLHGAGHAWSGGSSAGSYTDPRGPDASREMARFFLQHSNTLAAVNRD